MFLKKCTICPNICRCDKTLSSYSLVEVTVDPTTLTDYAAFSYVVQGAADLFPQGWSSDGGDCLSPPWTKVTHLGETVSVLPCSCYDSRINVCYPGWSVRPPTSCRHSASADKSRPRAQRHGVLVRSFNWLCKSWRAETRHMWGTSQQQVKPLKATKSCTVCP